MVAPLVLLQVAGPTIKIVQSGSSVTLVIAIAGVVLAVASIVWQVADYRLGGPRLKTRFVRGYSDGHLQLVSGPANSAFDSYLQQQGLNRRLLGIEITNVGRMATSVSHHAATSESGVGMAGVGGSINPAPDFRLEPHSTATWWVDLDLVEKAVQVTGQTLEKWKGRPQQVWMTASVPGRSIRTKETITVSS